MEKQITIFRNVRETITPYYLNLSEVYNRIKTPNTYRDNLISQIRNCNDKKQAGELKANLPSILFSGKFPHRKKGAEPLQHSGLIVLDIDSLTPDELNNTFRLIISDRFTCMAFVSPSGNGIKVIVKIPANISQHTGHFLAIEKYYLETFKINLDVSGKNIGRVCYESFDINCYYNEDSVIFSQYIHPIKSHDKSPAFNAIALKSEDEIINRVVTWWNKNYTFSQGRNVAIFQLACALNRFGVARNAALSYCHKYQDFKEKNPFLIPEIDRCVNRAYDTYINEHNTQIFEDKEKRASIVDEIMSASNLEAAAYNLAEYSEFEDFTHSQLQEFAEQVQVQEAQKRPSASATTVFWYNDDRGNIKLNNIDFIEFINSLGYYVYYSAEIPNEYEFIKITNNIISRVDERKIKEDVLNFVTSFVNEQKTVIYNYLTNNTKYFSKAFLNALPVIKPPILRDNAKVAYFPTQSGVFKITADRIEKISYVDLTDGYVWQTQITALDFDYTDKIGDFEKFANLVAGEKSNLVNSLNSIIGYMLHNYKSPSNSKAVFLFDGNLSQINGEAEGGSGKSLLVEGLRKIRETAIIPADRVDFTRSFVFQEVNESSQIAWVDELEKNTDMTKFFSRITNGIPIEKKNKTPLFIENAKSPKFIFTTNFKPKGISGSHVRRRIDFQVSNFFNVNNTPYNVFGKEFFTEWDKQEYNEFFSFYVRCTKHYLENGVININANNSVYMSCIIEFGDEITDYYFNDGNIINILNKKRAYINIDYQLFALQNEEKSKINKKSFAIYSEKLLSLFGRTLKTGRGNETNIKII